MKDEEKCTAIGECCEHYSYGRDLMGEVVICHCSHPNNADDHEGNCRRSLCPLTKMNGERA